MRRSLYVLACAVALAAPGAASAGANCSVGTVSGMSFGAYNPLATTDLDAAGTLSWRCTGNGALAIMMSRGSAPTSSRRAMAWGAERLEYELYLDAARRSVWGDTSGSYPSFDISGNQTPTQSVYGRVFAQQDVSAGAYADTVMVTFVF